MYIWKNTISRLLVLYHVWRSQYKFSPPEYWLYGRHGENPGGTKDSPSIQVISRDSDYTQLKINERRYYLPSELNRDSLSWIYREVFAPASRNFHAYEFAGVHINPGDRVIDAGAFAGFFVDYALQRGAIVLAIEPVPTLAEAMNKTFTDDIADGKVRILPAALGADRGQVKLSVVPQRIYESHIGNEGVEVEMTTLDDIGEGERIDFIKMDVEGSEMDAIRGGSRVIAVYKPRLAIAVYHETENARQVCELLRRIRPDYHIVRRGIYAWDGCIPRPFMVYAW